MVLKIFHLQSLCTVQPKTSGFPLWKSISSRPRTRRIHFRSGGQKLSSTVGTTTSLRKSIFSFLIFFVAASWSRRQSKAKRSETRTTSMLAKRIYNSYHLGFPTLNLGAINHQPFIGSRLSAVTSDFHSGFAGTKAVESSRA